MALKHTNSLPFQTLVCTYTHLELISIKHNQQLIRLSHIIQACYKYKCSHTFSSHSQIKEVTNPISFHTIHIAIEPHIFKHEMHLYSSPYMNQNTKSSQFTKSSRHFIYQGNIPKHFYTFQNSLTQDDQIAT